MAIDAAALNISVAKTHAALDPSFGIPPLSATANLNSPPTPIASSTHSLQYRHCAAEDLVTEGKQFDVVCAMEVIEHVEDPRGFLDCLSDLTKVPFSFPFIVRTISWSCECLLREIHELQRRIDIPPLQPGGLLLLSTINRTPLAQLLDIIMVEQVLRIVTPGTHTYSKFVRPSELQDYFAEKDWGRMEKRGCIYDPFKGGWRLLGMGEFGGAGEQANYFAGIRKPLYFH